MVNGLDSRSKSLPFHKAALAYLLAILVMLSLLELTAKMVLIVGTGSPAAFMHGLDSDTRIDINSLPRLDFSLIRLTDRQGKAAPAIVPVTVAPTPGKRPLVYAFGGSTTEGRSCGSTASSWPEQLNLLRSDLEIVNHGKSGSSSDDAIRWLSLALQKRTPDVVLWANWINERTFLSLSPGRNLQELSKTYPDLLADKYYGSDPNFSINKDRVRYRLAQVYFTGYSRSSFLFLMAEGVKRVSVVAHRARGTAPDMRRTGQTDRHIDMAIDNYLINTTQAMDLARKHGFKLILVRLPIDWSRFNKRESPTAMDTELDEKHEIDLVLRWNERFLARARAFAAENNLPFLNIDEQFPHAPELPGHYCDYAHLTLAGHQDVAKILNGRLTVLNPFP